MKLLAVRALHGAIAYGLCLLLFSCFPMLAQTFAPLAGSGALSAAPAGFSPFLFILLLMLTTFAVRPNRTDCRLS